MRSLFFKTSTQSHQKDTYAALNLVERKLTVITEESVIEYTIEDDLASAPLPQTSQIIHDANIMSLAVRVPGIIEVAATFPAQARGNLRDVIGYEIDRLTPMHAENAHFIYHVNEQGSDDVSILVDIAAVDAGSLSAAQNIAESLGCHLVYLGLDPVHQNNANLMQMHRRSDAQTEDNRFYLVTALLLFSLIATPFLQKQKQVAVLEEAVKPIENTARQKMAELNWLENNRMWMETIRQDSPRFLKSLQDLTNQLEERDIIFYLVWNKSELEIAGTASNSNQLIKKFATTSNVESIEYLNPIQSDTDQSLEGFHLKLRFVSRSSSEQSNG
ncbi:hypothetical protein [Kordiimonas aquimaris]|uniref:hypothetical protein n=1 Tax=Kordiimonas aquimaris TaxID=707591 RepID=UPI0021CFB825|nr:hypothetical protein [Kordiimonas aquimaris]